MDEMNITLSELLSKGLNNFPAGHLASTKRNGEWIKTDVDTFKRKVRHLALGLYDIGVRRGVKVALHAENSTEWIICDLALLSLGAVSVPIYTTQPGDQIKYILENSDAMVHI